MRKSPSFALHLPDPRLYSPPHMPAPPVKTSAAAPERSLDQRMEALKRANDIRTARAKLKKDLKAGRASIHTILLDPPEYVLTAKVFDMLLAVPKYGRVKTNRILNQCRISPSKTIGGLSERQRAELVACCAASAAIRPTARSRAVRRRGAEHAKVFVITGPSGVGKGTLIASCSNACPTSSSRSRRRPRGSRARARRTGVDYHFLTAGRVRRAGRGRKTSSSSPPTAATTTGPCARRSSGASTRATRSCSRSRSRGRSQVRAAMPESVQVFIAPPDPAVLRERLDGRGTDSAEAIDARLETAAQELAAQDEFDHRDRQRRPRAGGRASWRGSCAPSSALPARLRRRMIKPRVDKLLEHADSHYAAVVVSAKRARQINSYFHNLGEGGFGEYPPPMVETNAERNYLSMALEELAEGKLKYEYRS